MIMGVTYRGRHSSEFGLVVRTNPSILPEFENKTIKAPGSHGVIPVSVEYQPKIIPLEIGFVANDILDYSDRLRMLGDWLDPTKGVGEYVADHEPDKIYYAVLEESAINRVEYIARMGKGGLRLTCHDPYAYGAERTYDLSDSVAIANEGTADTYPVFDITITEESELLSITNTSNVDVLGRGRSVIIGTEVRPDEEVENVKTLILHDTMQSTGSWQGASSVDSGIVTGTMATDDEGFYAENYGNEDDTLRNNLVAIDTDINNRRTNLTIEVDNKQRELDTLKKKQKPTDADKTKMKNLQNEINGLNNQRRALDAERDTRRKAAMQGANYWVGPSLKRNLPVDLKSFIADIRIKNRNHRGANGEVIGKEGVGIIEVYFRDVNENMICKVQFGDTVSNAWLNQYTFAKPGDRRSIQSPTPADWNNFEGILRVMRDSTEYFPSIMLVKNGTVISSRDFGVITMNNSSNNNDVRSIQVAVRKYIGTARFYQRIQEIKVWSTVGAYEKPGIQYVHKFEAGDRIQIDSRKGLMILNGEPRTDLFHLGTDFFTLVKGLNLLETSGNFTGTVTFRERFV